MCVIMCFSILLAQEDKGGSQAGFLQSPLHTDPETSCHTTTTDLLIQGACTHPRPSTGSGWAPLMARMGPLSLHLGR